MTGRTDLTASTHEPPEDAPVFIWFARPQVGREQLLMTVVNGPDGVLAYRPMIALDTATAAAQQQVAAAAATELGVTAVCREYQFVSLVDQIAPET